MIYCEIVDQQPWTLFVSRGMKETELREKIVARLLLYKTDFVYVHGLSAANMKKIESVRSQLRDEYSEIKSKPIDVPVGIKIRFSL